MNRSMCCWIFIALVGLIIIFSFSYYFHIIDIKRKSVYVSISPDEPIYQSEHNTTMIYNSEGKLSYQLLADHIDFFAEKEIMQSLNPVATMFDINNIPTWIVISNKAKLVRNKMLYLYGDVQMKNIDSTLLFNRIITDNLVINLLTQDIYSNGKVTLYGVNFYSTGRKMQGNLRNKNAKLFEKVTTVYKY